MGKKEKTTQVIKVRIGDLESDVPSNTTCDNSELLI
jgi:hypothetical protein